MELITAKIIGLAEIQRALEEMPRGIARRFLRIALTRAANLWREEMARLAPRLKPESVTASRWLSIALGKSYRVPGFLAAHIGLQSRVTSDLEGEVRVGPVKKAFYALFLEFGTRKMPAQPFIRRAYEGMKEAVLAKLVELGKQIVAGDFRARS
jgi:HK97 gp10 family phage protein